TVGSDARARGPRRLRPGHPPRDPVERPAHGGPKRGDRAPRRPRGAHLADGQPRADRVHGAQAAVDARARARALRADRPRDAAKDYVRLRLCGERATDVADASGTLLFDVGARRWSDDVVG